MTFAIYLQIFVSVQEVPEDLGCKFQLGDGTGGNEIKLGNQKGKECVDACLKKRETDIDINGVTLFSDGKGGCWCEKKMKARNSNKIYKSCFLPGRTIFLVAFRKHLLYWKLEI